MHEVVLHVALPMFGFEIVGIRVFCLSVRREVHLPDQAAIVLSDSIAVLAPSEKQARHVQWPNRPPCTGTTRIWNVNPASS